MMNDKSLHDLMLWAKSKGVRMDGIIPTNIPARGIGIVATRKIRTDEEIMHVPEEAIYSLHSIPTSISSQLSSDIPLHGLLAADLALRISSTDLPWLNVLPTQANFTASVPLMWPEELHAFLPRSAYHILKRQQVKFQHECDSVAKAFPDLDRSKYKYFWLIINSRTFLYETPDTAKYRWEDKLCLLPAADLFNHSRDGCTVTWGEDDGYTITANRTYHAGDELCISYGDHTNDFLLVEYGFTMSQNPWDEVGLDEVILPKLDQAQQDALAQQGYLGEFKFHPETGPCIRTRAAISQIQRQVHPSSDSETSVSDTQRDALLKDLLRELLTIAQETLERLRELQIGDQSHRDLLIQRWGQIEEIVAKKLK
ncbi:putative SET domain-containing protein [Xylaria cf. heliscus]|nr:putative SET domain-containing protein [Xylaria cf. heliscus]